MGDIHATMPEAMQSGEGTRRADPSRYLDRISATILMLMKLAEGLCKLCLAIAVAFSLHTLLTALNWVFQQGSTVDDGKAMVAQVLKTLRVPPATIREVINALQFDIHFSSKPVVYVFLLSLPFVLIAVLEAVAAIRLRFGKGGTRMIGILQRVYFWLDAIRFLVFALIAVAVSFFAILRLGGAPGIALSTVYVSLTVFFILIALPVLFYHRYIAGIMDDIRFEMETGTRSAHRRTRFKHVLTALIVLVVIGAVVSVAAYWRPRQGDPAAALLVLLLIGPVLKLLKYICVKCCHRNFMLDGTAETNGSASHVPQVILIVLVTLVFAGATVYVCMQSNAWSAMIVEKTEAFMSEARETVNEVTNEAEAQIEAAQQTIDQVGAMQEAIGDDAAVALLEAIDADTAGALLEAIGADATGVLLEAIGADATVALLEAISAADAGKPQEVADTQAVGGGTAGGAQTVGGETAGGTTPNSIGGES